MTNTKPDPKYRLHKPTGQAVVTLNGHDFYLGAYDSSVSRERYHAKLQEWHQRGGTAPTTRINDGGEVTVGKHALAYLTHAADYYRGENGSTGEIDNIKSAIKPLLRLYNHTSALEFGPVKLRAVRGEMISMKWTRKNINRQICRVRRMFSWGASHEMLPGTVPHALQTVDGLRAGRSDAAESDPVKPVSQVQIDAVLSLVSRQVQTMIKLQLLTGMRPAEVCMIRGVDIDTKPDERGCWTYKPAAHKNAYRGQVRVVHFGPKAQALIAPWLKGDPNAYLFSPAEAEADRLAAMMERRTTKRQPSQVKRADERGTRKRKGWTPGVKYSVAAYRRAIASACDRAFELPRELGEMRKEARKWAEKWRHAHRGRRPRLKDYPAEMREKLHAAKSYLSAHRWHPHQLRHSTATTVRARYGKDGARALLGQKSLAAAEIYIEETELDLKKAAEIAAEVG
jgi:integrase